MAEGTRSYVWKYVLEPPVWVAECESVAFVEAPGWVEDNVIPKLQQLLPPWVGKTLSFPPFSDQMRRQLQLRKYPSSSSSRKRKQGGDGDMDNEAGAGLGDGDVTWEIRTVNIDPVTCYSFFHKKSGSVLSLMRVTGQ